MQRRGMDGSEGLLGNGPRANDRENRGARPRPIKGKNVEGFKKKKVDATSSEKIR